MLRARRLFSTQKRQNLSSLVQKYGRTALGLYLGISTIDLYGCYVLVKYGGASTVHSMESWISKHITGDSFSFGGIKHKVDDGRPSFVATFAAAYAIHKLLVPIRLPLTVAITPATVRWLVRRGWIKQIG